ncbi:MAG: CDP-glycerol glycerophosphotransferase family protein [Treponema sp.]|nr:CDP-glycerol glycerophosphotransferase family protein [Treponema sp.]
MKAAYCFFFMVCFTLPAAAYIDPGTGSMLFSLLTGLAVTAFFFVKNLIISLKSGLLSKGNAAAQAKKERLVIYSEGKQYWNVFKPILEALDKRGVDSAFYTSDSDDPGLSFQSSHIHAQFIGKGNAAYRFLNFLEADVCLMTTPALDVFQLKRSPGVSHYAHILHAVTDATFYRLFGIDYFDSVLLTGDYQRKDIRILEQKRGLPEKRLVTVGCTYLDALAERKARRILRRADPSGTTPPPPHEAHTAAHKTVLVAPSWGANALLRRYALALLEPLANSSYHVIIRPHPQSMFVEKDVVETMRSALASHPNIEWNFDAENNAVLSRADILISDFSGVIFDYAFLFERPVVYPSFTFDTRPYDLADIEEEAWTFRAIREIGVPLDEAMFADIETALNAAIENAQSVLKSERARRLKDEAWMYRGEAGERVVDFLLEAGEKP